MKRTLMNLSLAATMTLMPAMSMADGGSSRDHRAQMQNQWKNIGVGPAAVGLIGLLTHNDTWALAGAAGAIYSDSRYEQDRNSQHGRFDWDRDQRDRDLRDRDRREQERKDQDRRDQDRRDQEERDRDSRNSRDNHDWGHNGH